MSTRKHSGRRAATHVKAVKAGEAATKKGGNKHILKRRGEHARKEAEKTKARGMPWDHDVAAARWKEEIEEARSVTAGTHPKLAGLEDEELERRDVVGHCVHSPFHCVPRGKIRTPCCSAFLFSVLAVGAPDPRVGKTRFLVINSHIQ